jgi:hypothetical protein
MANCVADEGNMPFGCAWMGALRPQLEQHKACGGMHYHSTTRTTAASMAICVADVPQATPREERAPTD